MDKLELERLIFLEKRIKEIAEEFGLLTTDIDFEIVPAQRVLEGMAYNFPKNFSHWSFGRDYDMHRTIFEHTGQGIPYEQVWNFERPKALVVETNPFALKVLVIAHVFGHVDYFLRNNLVQHGRSFADIAQEARDATDRFKKYEEKYGADEVEKTIDAGMSIQWQQHLDPFLEEELDNELARERLIEITRAKLERNSDFGSEFQSPLTKEEKDQIEKYLRHLSQLAPPRPIYDILGYIIKHSLSLKPWQKDVLGVVRNQARALSPMGRTKMADEGWATYWHLQIMRKLFEEKLLDGNDHGVFNDFHSAVTRESRTDFNWYRVGLALFEDIKERWDRGCFGRDFELCEDPVKKAYWDNGAMKGKEKIFQVASFYSDRMIIEEFFTDEFIRKMRLYLYQAEEDPSTGDTIYGIAESRPEVIRMLLKHAFTLYGMMPIKVQNSNHNGQQQLYLKHDFSGLEMDPQYREGTMRNIFYLWNRKVYLESIEDSKQILYSFDGHKHKTEKDK
ncbi:MAG TPA: SpoVR family protein [Candidatus Paceibacterota bacterium]